MPKKYFTSFKVSKIHEPRPIKRCNEIQHYHEDHETRSIEMLEDKIIEVPVEKIVEHIVEVPEIQNVEKIVEDVIEVKKMFF